MRRSAAALTSVLVGLVFVAGAASAETRFFVAGTGHLAIVNGHTDEKVAVRYRNPDESYDAKALARLRHVFRSRGDTRDPPMPVRLVEVLSRLQQLAGGKPIVLVSGYRSPDYNESIRAAGAKAASGSVHTEGLAADVALPRPLLLGLWKKIRALECCGAGYYAKEGFLHVDIGRPRFWEAKTSRVDENLSASNARLFALTEFDRYPKGEDIIVTLHALTVPPVRIASAARLVTEGGETVPIALSGSAEPDRDACVEIAATGASVRVSGLTTRARGRIVLATCEPRQGPTPAKIETNEIEIR